MSWTGSWSAASMPAITDATWAAGLGGRADTGRRWTSFACAATRWRCCGCWSIPARSAPCGGQGEAVLASPACVRGVCAAGAAGGVGGHVPERTGPRLGCRCSMPAPGLSRRIRPAAVLVELPASFTGLPWPLPGPGGRADADAAVQRVGPGAVSGPAGGGSAGRAAGVCAGWATTLFLTRCFPTTRPGPRPGQCCRLLRGSASQRTTSPPL